MSYPNEASHRPGRALVLNAKADKAEQLRPRIVNVQEPVPEAGHAVVRVQAAAVNPSDVKAALGMMPHAVWPRTPGRDFAGIVIAGPKEWIGVDVWGTGGDLGISRDGTHARYLVLPVAALSRRPRGITAVAGATVGVPFVTAHEGLRRAGLEGTGQTVVVFGANGKVGQAAVQLATRAGAKVVGVDRGAAAYRGHSCVPIVLVDGTRPDLAGDVMLATGEGGADIVYNTVGSPYFAAALDVLAVDGTQILISTIEHVVPLNILSFYRRNLQMLGLDTLKLSVTQCAAILDGLAPGFEDGSLKAFEVDEASLVPLEEAADAYRRVLEGSGERVVLAP